MSYHRTVRKNCICFRISHFIQINTNAPVYIFSVTLKKRSKRFFICGFESRMKEKNEREKCPVLIRAVKKPTASCSETITIINCIWISFQPSPIIFELVQQALFPGLLLTQVLFKQLTLIFHRLYANISFSSHFPKKYSLTEIETAEVNALLTHVKRF